MAYTGIDCRQYRTRMAERRRRLGAGAGTAPPAVADTSALALEFADQLPPGLARPMLALISMLDPNGIPGAVLTTPAACAYLSRFGNAAPVDEVRARAAVHALGRLGLVTIDTTSAARTVRVHELVQAAAGRAYRPPSATRPPSPPPTPCSRHGRRRRCRPHPARPCATARPGSARSRASCSGRPSATRSCSGPASAWTAPGFAGPAIAYWQSMIDIGRPTLGATHAHTILASDRLAAAYDAAGRHMDAIPVHERVLAERERELGPAHHDTLNARNSLTRTYRAAGRGGDAVRLAERALADCERVQGPGHPDTLAARSELAQAYLSAGLRDQAIAVFERALAGQEQVLGPRHPDTLTARANLAHAYRRGGPAEGRDLAVRANPGRPGEGAGR